MLSKTKSPVFGLLIALAFNVFIIFNSNNVGLNHFIFSSLIILAFILVFKTYIKDFTSHIFYTILNILRPAIKTFTYLKNLRTITKTNKYKEDLKRTQKEFEDLQKEFKQFEEYYKQEKAKWEEELKQQYQSYKRQKENKGEQQQKQKTYQEYKQEKKEKSKARFVFDGKMDYTTALKVLELKTDFTAQELKKSYKEKALKYHPDKQFNKSKEDILEAGEYFKQVNSAFMFLKDYK